jgi:hypothetical protein
MGLAGWRMELIAGAGRHARDDSQRLGGPGGRGLDTCPLNQETPSLSIGACACVQRGDGRLNPIKSA